MRLEIARRRWCSARRIRVQSATGHGWPRTRAGAGDARLWRTLLVAQVVHPEVPSSDLMPKLPREPLEPRLVRIDGRVATLYEQEWLHIEATLAACGGNVSETARRLGITRQSLQRKLQRTPPPTLTRPRRGA